MNYDTAVSALLRNPHVQCTRGRFSQTFSCEYFLKFLSTVIMPYSGCVDDITATGVENRTGI